MDKKINILGINIDNISTKEAIEKINTNISKNKTTKIFTPNTTIIVKSSRDEHLKAMLNSADISIPDGAGVRIASKILGSPVNDKLAGIELGEDILYLAEKNNFKVFLLGGSQEVSKKAEIELKQKYRNLNICGANDGYFDVKGIENNAVIDKINNAKPDILFVCMGFPRQEEWIVKNIDKLTSTKVAIGLGGSLDVWSGRLKRAPSIFRKLLLEWLWRMMLEPKRSGVIFIIPVFLLKVIKQKLFILTKISGKNAHIKPFFNKK